MPCSCGARVTARGQPRTGSGGRGVGFVRVRRDGCSLPSNQREGPRGARTTLRAPGRRCPPPLPTHATPRRLLEKASSERHGPAPEGGYLGLCPARAGPQQPMGGRRRWVRLVKPQPRDNGGGGTGDGVNVTWGGEAGLWRERTQRGSRLGVGRGRGPLQPNLGLAVGRPGRVGGDRGHVLFPGR